MKRSARKAPDLTLLRHAIRSAMIGEYGQAQAQRDLDDLASRVAELEQALREIADYEEPWPQDPSDVYEHFQAVARAVLVGKATDVSAGTRDEETTDKPSQISDYGVLEHWYDHPFPPEGSA